MAVLLAVEISEKASSGNPIPIPKNTKLRMFSRKLVVETVLVKRTAINAGLQGTTIAPKKKPNKNALNQGFLVPVGAWTLGRNLPMSILNINRRLINSRMPKAIGDTTPTTLVRDTCKNVVNTSPSRDMDKITPEVITTPNKAIVCLPASFPDS
jgi:hypothetical protein